MKFNDALNIFEEGKVQGELNLNPTDKKTIKDFFNAYGKKKIRDGLGGVELKGNTLKVSWMGNMGNSIEKNVDPMLQRLGLPLVQDLKNNFPRHKEEGSPDYAYSLELKLESMVEEAILNEKEYKWNDKEEVLQKAAFDFVKNTSIGKKFVGVDFDGGPKVGKSTSKFIEYKGPVDKKKFRKELESFCDFVETERPTDLACAYKDNVFYWQYDPYMKNYIQVSWGMTKKEYESYKN